MTTDALATASKIIQKTEATGNFIGNKIANRINRTASQRFASTSILPTQTWKFIRNT